MENKLNKITNLSEKKPTQAIIYMLLSALASLAMVIVWQNNRIGNKEEDKEVAVEAQRVKDEKVINFWILKSQASDKKADDCQELALRRTDENAKILRKDYDELSEKFEKSIMSRRTQSATIKKIADAIPAVKAPVKQQTDEN